MKQNRNAPELWMGVRRSSDIVCGTYVVFSLAEKEGISEAP